MPKKKDLKNTCGECGAIINERYELCKVCNEKSSTEIAIANKFDDLNKNVEFYKSKLIDKFRNHDTLTLSFIEKYSAIANETLRQIKHMGILEDKRYIQKVKGRNPPYMELEYIKVPIFLIPSLKALKKDRQRKYLKWYD